MKLIININSVGQLKGGLSQVQASIHSSEIGGVAPGSSISIVAPRGFLDTSSLDTEQQYTLEIKPIVLKNVTPVAVANSV